MGEITLAQSLTYVRDGGIVGLLVLALVGGHRRLYAWYYQLDECKERERAWQKMFEEERENTRRAMGIVAELTAKVAELTHKLAK